MRSDSFSAWLAAYGHAWEQGDPDAIVRIFSPDATYFETPFGEPMRGHAAIRAYWVEGARDGQRDVKFHAQPVMVIDNVGYARWRAVFTRVTTASAIELDGMLAARFVADGRCSEFREWWHRREAPA